MPATSTIGTTSTARRSPRSRFRGSRRPVRRVAERRWRAMGSDAHLLVVGFNTDTSTADPQGVERLADAAVDRVAELEGRWSRFLPTTEISRLNRTGWARVSAETFALVDRAVFAWHATGGRFDPLQLRQLERLGYDRPFEHLHSARSERAEGVGPPVDSLPTGCAGIVLDPYTGTIVLPGASPEETTGPTATFDPGGIGKGLAADLVVEELMAAGADGALVNIGGDLRVDGAPPAGDCWVIEAGEEAWSNEPIAVLELETGGVATSTPLRRRWGDSAHHLLDPRTGRPAEHGPVLVTAIAGEAWWAEAAATALAAASSSQSNATGGDGAGLDNVAAAIVDLDGAVRFTGGFQRFARPLSPTAVTGPLEADDVEERRWDR